MAECNLVGGPPHVWSPWGPTAVKCNRCGVEQNWQGAWDGLMKRMALLDAVASAARDDLVSYKTVGDTPTGSLYMAVAGVEAERRLIVLRDTLRDLDAL